MADVMHAIRRTYQELTVTLTDINLRHDTAAHDLANRVNGYFKKNSELMISQALWTLGSSLVGAGLQIGGSVAKGSGSIGLGRGLITLGRFAPKGGEVVKTYKDSEKNLNDGEMSVLRDNRLQAENQMQRQASDMDGQLAKTISQLSQAEDQQYHLRG